MPCSLTPVGPQRLAFATPWFCRRFCDSAGPGIQFDFEALSHGSCACCLRFTAGVTAGPCKTRFRLLARLCRAGLPPAGSRCQVSVAEHPPNPGFSWRTANAKSGSPGLPRGPHRSGRADFPHPAPRVTVSLRERDVRCEAGAAGRPFAAGRRSAATSGSSAVTAARATFASPAPPLGGTGPAPGRSR